MERQVCAEEGYTRLQENHWSQADECSYAEEIVGDDEGALGGAEGQGVGQGKLCVSALSWSADLASEEKIWRVQIFN
jgi:hypothetical protein